MYLLVIAFLLSILPPGPGFHEASPGFQERKIFYTVTKVVDGDTFWIDDGTEKGQKIRLIGIDAPESRKTRNKQIQKFGKESKEFAVKLLLNKKVRLEYDVRRYDQYRRTLAYAYLTDGTFVNAMMIKEGYAQTMTVPPNVKYAEKLAQLQQQARSGGKGLWRE